MKKLFFFIISIGFVVSSTLIPSYASEKNDAIKIGNYDYKLSQHRDYNRVSVIDNKKILYDVVYDKIDNVLKVNGKLVGYVEMDSTSYLDVEATFSANSYSSMLMIAKNYWDSATIKKNYKITIFDVAVLVAAVISLKAVAAFISVSAVSTGTVKAALSKMRQAILSAFGAAGMLSHYTGKYVVSGYTSFTLQRRGDGSSRYAKRKINLKITIASKSKSKTHTFKDGGWWKSTRPLY